MGLGSHFSHESLETDMNNTINPFQQLYFSDDTQSEDNYVELFSDEVLQTAIHPVFQGGNVVLSGTQGCGKTMILSLLRPETRISYWNKGKEFPVSLSMRNFVSAGVNLTRSRITDIVQVSLHQGEEVDEREMPLYFADFFNYLVVEDLIKSTETIGLNSEIFDTIVDYSKVDSFAKLLAEQVCWFGSLSGVVNIEQLKKRVSSRVDFYRRWVNGNLADLQPPEEVRQSKTNIGEPISKAAECLRQSGMISGDIPVLIRVDQIEELHRAFTTRQSSLLLSFRKMINRAFAARDARVHYRAGTRRYGWRNPDFLSIWGSEARLEERRDYLMVDMDAELFLRKETKKSIFENFAADTFQRRINYYYRDDRNDLRPNLAKTIFGKHPTAEQRLEQLNKNATAVQIDRALALDVAADGGEWSKEWRAFLRKLYRFGHSGMLDAVLAAAWGRQTGGARSKIQHRESPPPKDAPWKTRKWWRKERLDQAVLQLSTRCQQRFMWWGFNDICSLSGGNITVFLHICHRIWDGFLKHQSSLPPEKQVDLLNGGGIERSIQDIGILTASNEWFKKLPEEPRGDSRQRFISNLGTHLNGLMLNDLRMSYPGGNGISIALNEWQLDSEDAVQLRKFINDTVDFGVLYETEHSSKTKSGGRRMKYYLHPILCPRFQLPEARTKEPYYWRLSDLADLARKAAITIPKVRSIATQSSRQGVFDFGGDEA